MTVCWDRLFGLIAGQGDRARERGILDHVGMRLILTGIATLISGFGFGLALQSEGRHDIMSSTSLRNCGERTPEKIARGRTQGVIPRRGGLPYAMETLALSRVSDP
jgi:hypothetical protein